MPLYVPPSTSTVMASGAITKQVTTAVGTFDSGTLVNFVPVQGGSNIGDTYGIYIQLSNGAASNSTRNYLVNIGFYDGAVGQIIIPNLIGGSSSPETGAGNGQGIWYYFPLYIPTSLPNSYIYVSVNGTVSGSTISVSIYLDQKKSNPGIGKYGTYVESFGEVLGSAAGTAFTLGTTAEGAYTQVGTTTREYWWWQVGFAYADNSQTLQALTMDAAAGSSTTNNKILLENQPWVVNTAEQISNVPWLGYKKVGIGENIYVRGQTSITTADTGPTAIVYGLGG